MILAFVAVGFTCFIAGMVVMFFYLSRLYDKAMDGATETYSQSVENLEAAYKAEAARQKRELQMISDQLRN